MTPATPGGLAYTLRGFLATSVSLARTRLALVSTELQEELHRAVAIVLWGFAAILFGGFALAFAALGAFAAYPDERRVVAAAIAAAIFLAIATTCGIVLVHRRRAVSRPLDASLRELEDDYEILRPKP
jgi:uncharacterized membrane protein YqjE